MIELRDRPIFICGHPKSGTSLLRNLLDFHPQLVVYPEESRFFRQFLPLAKDALPGSNLANGWRASATAGTAGGICNGRQEIREGT